jgi:DNA-binding response OmpR family regulator
MNSRTWDSTEQLGEYDLSGLDILLVEDNLHMRRIIRTILHSLGVKKVREAEDATSGLAMAQEAGIDMILCSWLMDIVEGPEFVQLIRSGKNSKNPYVPIIMLSAFTEMSKIVAARDAGINEFLVKPVSPKSLYQRIVAIIEKPRPFVRTSSFFGPCRRRQSLGPPSGISERRVADPTPVSAKSELLQDLNRQE